MDKSWMQLRNRWSDEYIQGVKVFLESSSTCIDKANRMRCPCRDCNNVHFRTVDVVEKHLLMRGMDQQYTRWIHHGEEPAPVIHSYDVIDDEIEDNVDEMQEILEDIHRGTNANNFSDASPGTNSDRPTGMDKFSKLLADAKSSLHPGCEKFSKLSFIVKLMHIKTISRWSNKSFDMLLELLKEVFPPENKVPKSHYDSKIMIRDLGLGYEIIHACKNNCILFRKEYAAATHCPKCGESRYINKQSDGKKNIAQKVLRYFDIKPRFQRLFMSRNIAGDMCWHKDKRVIEENVLRHPADSVLWKDFDMQFPWFSEDPRNIRFGLATDGFNPFGNMSNSYSMWPVMLMPYNLPPWKCMKEPFIILSLLIPGPKSPGNDIDIFLQPLVDDLNELWTSGLETYDAAKQEYFQLHAALLWTINDFPAYANLSGWSTKGKLACPTCNENTCSFYLKNGRKICYMGYRRYLPPAHIWRKKTTMFDGKQEHGTKPKELTGEELLEQMKGIDVTFGITQNRKRKRAEWKLNWTKESIFFKLSYWKTHPLRHNLDVMHIEKNIFESLFGTLMNIEGKTKDSVKARMDLAEMGIKKELHLKLEGTRYVMPHPCFTLSKSEKKGLCEFIKSVKYPDGYATNISRCVSTTDGKILGMKSHDCHVFLQRLLPVAVRGYLRKDVFAVVYELSRFFRELCRRTLKLDILDQLEADIILILCKLETIMPPSFFDIMVHLAVHLPNEAKIAGPVQYRWMYPIERFLHTNDKEVGRHRITLS